MNNYPLSRGHSGAKFLRRWKGEPPELRNYLYTRGGTALPLREGGEGTVGWKVPWREREGGAVCRLGFSLESPWGGVVESEVLSCLMHGRHRTRPLRDIDVISFRLHCCSVR